MSALRLIGTTSVLSFAPAWLRGLCCVVIFCHVLLPTEQVHAVSSCRDITDSFHQLVTQGFISADLAPLMDSAVAVCPTASTGDGIQDKCSLKNSAIGEDEMEDWNGIDFGWQTLQLFLSHENYSACNHVFGEDAFIAAANRIEEVQGRALRKYEYLSGFKTSYECQISDLEVSEEFESTQLRVFSVFESVGSWNFCAHKKTHPLTGYEVLGEFDNQGRITLYEGACTNTDIYGMNTLTLSPMHRGILVAAHEFGHAFAAKAGLPSGNSKGVRELLATYWGLFVAECWASRLENAANCYGDIIESTHSAKPLDARYQECQENRWRTMQKELASIRNSIALRYPNLTSGKVATEASENVSKWEGPCLAYELESR